MQFSFKLMELNKYNLFCVKSDTLCTWYIHTDFYSQFASHIEDICLDNSSHLFLQIYNKYKKKQFCYHLAEICSRKHWKYKYIFINILNTSCTSYFANAFIPKYPLTLATFFRIMHRNRVTYIFLYFGTGDFILY